MKKTKNICKMLTIAVAAALLLAMIPITATAASKVSFYDGELYNDSARLYGLQCETSVADFYDKLTDKTPTLKDKSGNAFDSGSDDYIGTGMTLSFAYSTYTFVILGDTNGDGRITTTDYFTVKRNVLGKYALSSAYAKAADADCDGSITSSDYLAIKAFFKEKTKIEYVLKTSEETDPDWVNKGEIVFSGDKATVSGTGVTAEGSSVTISAGGDFKVTGRSDSAMITVNCEEKVKLRLAGCDLSNSTGPVINFAKAQKSFITLSDGTINYLTDGASYTTSGKATLFSENDLEIKGGGALYITGNYKHGIACDADLAIENGQITVMSAKTDGLHINNSITISGGTLNVKNTGSDGIECAGTKAGEKGTIAISGGKINVSKTTGTGIKALGAVSVTGGEINISEVETAVKTSANFGMNAGKLDINCNGNGIKAIGTVQIMNKSAITIVTQNDGIDGNASVTVSGGTIDITSVDKTIQSDGKVTIFGGTLTLTEGQNRIFSTTDEIEITAAATINAK